MKFLAPLALLTIASFMTTPLLAAEDTPQLTGCAAKRQAISTQIEQAKAHGNSAQQAGLEKALGEVTANCRRSVKTRCSTPSMKSAAARPTSTKP